MRSSLNISMPAPLKSWIVEQVESRGYSTASEFVREILRKEQAAATAARINANLLESLESGPSRAMDRKSWDRIRREGIALARRRKIK